MRNERPNNSELPEDLWAKVVQDRAIRRAVTRESHLMFFHLYFAHYVKFETASFQKEIFAITEDESIKVAVIEAFRGSAKTTLVSLSYSIWAILGKQQRKFIVLLSQTQQQARLNLANIKREFETNAILRQDLGPFEEPDDEWRSTSIVLPKYGARITIASIDQPIRGLRHGPHRPDLIVCDDLEDLASVKNRETRNKLYDWLMGDVMLLGDTNTRLMVIGTRLHDDSLIMRLREKIQTGKMSGIIRSYPLIDGDGNIAWPGKFPDQLAIEEHKKKLGDERAWLRECMLQIVSGEGQIIKYEWLEGHDYDDLPDNENLMRVVISVDPASSKKERADRTAIVVFSQYHANDNWNIYVHPNPVNEQLSGMEIQDRIIELYNFYARQDLPVEVLLETTSQNYLTERLAMKGILVRECRPKGDKSERLRMAGAALEAGLIHFHRIGCDELKQQLTGFGHEAHDDLVDSFSQGVNEILGEDPNPNLDTIVLDGW